MRPQRLSPYRGSRTPIQSSVSAAPPRSRHTSPAWKRHRHLWLRVRTQDQKRQGFHHLDPASRQHAAQVILAATDSPHYLETLFSSKSNLAWERSGTRALQSANRFLPPARGLPCWSHVTGTDTGSSAILVQDTQHQNGPMSPKRSVHKVNKHSRNAVVFAHQDELTAGKFQKQKPLNKLMQQGIKL